MDGIKVILLLISEADLDPKTTVIKLKSIQYQDKSTVFQFEGDDQFIRNHSALASLPIVKLVIKSLNKRGKSRKINITLGSTMQKLYLDGEGNFVFNGYYLEELVSQTYPNNPTPLFTPTNTLKSISKNMVLNNYNNESKNAKAWLKLFLMECHRLEVHEDKYSEVLRFFLSDSALDWYNSMLTSVSLNSPWNYWESSFIETFGESTWKDIEYAYKYRFMGGSFLDYALKKRNLLLNIDPQLSISSQINFIVIGLPKFAWIHLNKGELNSIENLMSKLRQIQPSSQTINSYQNNTHTNKDNENHNTKSKYKHVHNSKTNHDKPHSSGFVTESKN